MLPTVANPLGSVSIHTWRAAGRVAHSNHAAGVPCRSRALTTRTQVRWTDPAQASVAAGWCERCPLATPCLLQALRLDAAYRHGEDPWGLTGVCGGVWFDPAHSPRRLTSQAPG